VAIFYMGISSVTRGTGRRATAAAAYRSGERIRDERSGKLYNHMQRRDVLHTEIFLPSHLERQSLTWARDRQSLWNAAEHAEKRHNSRVAREFEVTLPAELNAGQRIALARAFSREIADRYKVAVDLAVHAPRPDGDPRNFHAHLLATTREVTPAGLGAKTGLDMQVLERRRRELPDHRQEYINVRERWATLTNEALREANVAARIDHRSLAAQGIEREPLPAIPLMNLRMERRGVPSEFAERLRAEYRERVQRRLERSGTPAVTAPGPAESSRAEVAAAAASAAAAAGQSQSLASPLSAARVTDLEEIRRQAREAWLQLRSKEAARTDGQSHEPQERAERAATGEREALPSEGPSRDDLAL
jgi:ATP-dependent exoDNAse (exonuclease V) alpha subunit